MRGSNPTPLSTGLLLGTMALALGGCGQEPPGSPESSFGATPNLPAPKSGWWPTVNIARATGWPAGATPKAAPGLAVSAFATGLDHPRWLSVLPNGDVLVAETNAPDKPDDGKGIKGYIEGWVMWAAGATVPSANRITLLRPKADGTLERRSTFLSGLNSPFGMALVGDTLYVADSDAVLRFPYKTGDTSIAAKGEKVADLPAGRINHHWTKDVIASPDGKTLFVTVGSNSNVAENGIEAETNRASVLAIDPADGKTRVFASGLRNPNGLSWEPESKALWVVVNERDEIGDDLVPDYMTSVKDGAFYGWPYSWYGQHVDVRVQPQRPDLVAKAIPPDYALGAHTASLGLTFDVGSHLPAGFTGGAFVGQHGSWNRTPRSGYKVIFVPFKDGKPDGQPRDVLTGFLSEGGQAQGRPVGVRIDARGGLLVADDVGNTIWRVTAATGQNPS